MSPVPVPDTFGVRLAPPVSFSPLLLSFLALTFPRTALLGDSLDGDLFDSLAGPHLFCRLTGPSSILVLERSVVLSPPSHIELSSNFLGPLSSPRLLGPTSTFPHFVGGLELERSSPPHDNSHQAQNVVYFEERALNTITNRSEQLINLQVSINISIQRPPHSTTYVPLKAGHA